MTVTQEISIIVDRSGSMQGKEVDTVGGINTTINELKNNKEEDTKINFSLKFFDHEEYLRIRSIPIEKVREIPVNDLKPRGQTALYDAIGNSLMYLICEKIKNPKKFDMCSVYIATDGYENCSKHYSSESLKNIINVAKNYKIDLFYLAANQDAILEANKFGLSSDQALNYTETRDNVESAYRSLAQSAKRARSGLSVGFTDSERQASKI